jgi:hypothetical protein
MKRHYLIKLGGKYGNPFTDWEDESFTVYPKQAGTPFIFSKIPEESREPDPLF